MTYVQWSLFVLDNLRVITSIIVGFGVMFFAWGSLAMQAPQIFYSPQMEKSEVINEGLATSLFGSGILALGVWMIAMSKFQ